MRDNLSLDVQRSLFDDYPSVKELRQYLTQRSTTNSSAAISEASTSEANTGTTTPLTAAGETYESKPENLQYFSATLKSLLNIVADKMGVDSNELADGEDLAEMGLDSLLSLTVIGRAREELNVHLPQNLLQERIRWSEVQATLLNTLGGSVPSSASPQDKPTRPTMDAHLPPATSVILQGDKNSRASLFLCPDASGSARSYLGLSKMPDDVCLIGMNCPYVKAPQDLKCSL